MDIFMIRQDRKGNVTENVVVELKRPTVALGEDQLSQDKKYMQVIRKDDRFNMGNVKWTFYLVGNKFNTSGYIEGELDNNKNHGEAHLVYCIDNGMTKIYVLKWSEIFDEFSKRHEYLLDKLKLEEELWLRKHNSADEVVADALDVTGTNVILFDADANTRVYDVTGSKVYTVNTLDIDVSQVMPIENEEKEQSQMLFICYPKCSTCQKAKKWLDEHNIKYTERHIVDANPTYDELAEWYRKSGLPLKKFFNTSGLIYKEMQLKDKLSTMSEEEQLQMLATNGMLVKRPLIVNGDTVLVGFKEVEWSTHIL